MAKKKKDSDAIAGFDAVAASRRWRQATSRKLNKMTFAQQQEYLRHATEELFASVKPSRHARALAHRQDFLPNPAGGCNPRVRESTRTESAATGRP